jgi:pyocin large subunit-like protein
MERNSPHPLDMMAGKRGRKEGPVYREVQALTVSAEAFGAGDHNSFLRAPSSSQHTIHQRIVARHWQNRLYREVTGQYG